MVPPVVALKVYVSLVQIYLAVRDSHVGVEEELMLGMSPHGELVLINYNDRVESAQLNGETSPCSVKVLSWQHGLLGKSCLIARHCDREGCSVCVN
jgi:hypothetical protein